MANITSAVPPRFKRVLVALGFGLGLVFAVLALGALLRGRAVEPPPGAAEAASGSPTSAPWQAEARVAPPRGADSSASPSVEALPPATGAFSRAAAAPAPARVVVVDGALRPLAGAQLSLHRIEPHHAGPIADRERWLAAAAVEAALAQVHTSDVDGAVELPAGASGGDWLFATAHGKAATLVALADVLSRGALLVCADAPTATVRVRTVDRAPATGAMLRVAWIDPPSSGAPAPSDLEPALVRELELDAAAAVVLAGGAPRRWIAAHRGDERAVPFAGEVPADLELVLGPSYTLDGAVYALDGAGDTRSGARSRGSHVLVRALDGMSGVALAAAAVGADGHFGPLRVPLVAGNEQPEHLAYLALGRLAAQQQSLGAPLPGDRRSLHFDAQPGVEAAFVVLGADGAPLGAADIFAGWSDALGEQGARNTTDPFGEARLVLPEGLPVELVVRADGYADFNQTLEPLAAHSGGPMRTVRLTWGGALRLRARLAGVSIPEFELWLWTRDSNAAQESRWPTTGADGFARIDGLHPGPWSAWVVAPDGASARVDVDVAAGETRVVDVELRPARRITGRVLARTDRRPVPGAVVGVEVLARGDVALGWLAVSAPADPDGHFELFPVPAQAQRLIAAANGHATLAQPLGAGAVFDPPSGIELLLEPAAELRVRLDAQPDGGAKPVLDGYRLLRDIGDTVGIAFDHAGRARLDALAGTLQIASLTRLGDVRVQTIDFDPLEHPEAVLAVAPGRTLELHLLHTESLPPSGEPLDWRLVYTDPGGHVVTQFARAPAGVVFAVERMPADEVEIHVQDATGGLIVRKRVALDGVRSVELEPAPLVLDVMLLDLDGEPLGGLDLWLHGSALNGAGAASLTVDGSGRARVRMSPGDVLRAVLRDVLRDVLLGGAQPRVTGVVEIAAAAARAGVIELRLDPARHVELAVRDGDLALDGRAFYLQDESGALLVGAVAPLPSGGFGFRGLQPGRYRLTAAPDGPWYEPRTLDLGPGVRRIDAEARRRGGLVLDVRSPTGPAAGAAVALESLDAVWGGRTAVWAWMELGAVPRRPLVADGDGVVRLVGLPHGRYRVLAEWGNLGAETSVVLEPGAETRAVVPLR